MNRRLERQPWEQGALILNPQMEVREEYQVGKLTNAAFRKAVIISDKLIVSCLNFTKVYFGGKAK